MSVRKSCLIAVCALAAMSGSAWAQANSPTKPGEAKPAAQPTKPGDKPAQPAIDPETAAMIAAGKPGEFHKHLEQLAGEWEATCRMFTPGQETPEEAKMTCSSKMEFDGRYLYSHWSGDFGGMPFKGVSVIGYNNVTKQYESTWIDNMSTSVAYRLGTCDSAGKVFTYAGEDSEPTAGRKIKVREVMTVVDKDHNKFEFFKAGPDGKDFKSMEIESSRKAAPAKPNRPKVNIESTQPGETKKPAPAK